MPPSCPRSGPAPGQASRRSMRTTVTPPPTRRSRAPAASISTSPSSGSGSRSDVGARRPAGREQVGLQPVSAGIAPSTPNTISPPSTAASTTSGCSVNDEIASATAPTAASCPTVHADGERDPAERLAQPDGGARQRDQLPVGAADRSEPGQHPDDRDHAAWRAPPPPAPRTPSSRPAATARPGRAAARAGCPRRLAGDRVGGGHRHGQRQQQRQRHGHRGDRQHQPVAGDGADQPAARASVRSATATPIAISTGISANTPSNTSVRGRRSTQRSSAPSSRPSGACGATGRRPPARRRRSCPHPGAAPAPRGERHSRCARSESAVRSMCGS